MDNIIRWIIPISDFTVALKQAIADNDVKQTNHLIADFWFCDEYMLLKSDIQGELQ